ncbi:efflux RND transporter permease subunit, partial [Gemmatimonadota bacterium]
MKPFFRFFAERHILANLITIMVILLGLNTLLTIKRDIYPKVDFGQLMIITRYPGASPEDVEFNVTNKIERELKGVTGLDNVTSISMENVSVINAIIDIDAGNQEKVKSEIREAVARVTDLPPEVTESPQIEELHSTMFAVIEVGLSGEVPYRDLREQARLFEKKLKEVPGVASLDRIGWRAREIRVEVSPDEIAEYQIPIREIIAAIQGRNIRGTAGSLESYTSERDLVTLAQFRDPREVGNVIVRSSFEGPLVRIRDLAIVRDDFEDERVLSRMNGKAAISFRVAINESADVMRTCDAVKELIAKERENLPEEVEILYVNDLSRIVRSSFEVLLNNGLIGLLLVIIILPIFLTFRTAFWVAMGIPISLLGAIFLLPLFGVYLDTVLFTGLILVIGIIVDDAIIVAENVSSWQERGHAPLEAAVEGLNEVFRPVVTTVLTTFLVFAPMFFLPGLFGKYLIVIPLAISLALFVSLAEVTIVMPAHLVPSMKGEGKSTGRSWFTGLRDHYERIIARLLKLRYLMIGVFVALMMAVFIFLGKGIDFILFPAEMADSFTIIVEMPIGTPLQTTSDKVHEIEELISGLPEEELSSFNTWIGVNIIINAESENYAGIGVNLTPFTRRDRQADEIVEALRTQTDQLEGTTDILYYIDAGGPP